MLDSEQFRACQVFASIRVRAVANRTKHAINCKSCDNSFRHAIFPLMTRCTIYKRDKWKTPFLPAVYILVLSVIISIIFSPDEEIWRKF